MKKILAALLLALCVNGTARAAVVVGQPAPDYRFTDIEGRTHSIAGFKGKTLVLEWTNPGCPFVKKFYDANEMQRVQAQAVRHSDTVWIAINSSAEGKEGFMTDDEAKKYKIDHKSNETAYVRDPSGEFGKLYGAKTTPHMFVIDRDGNVAYQGAIDSIKSFDAADIKQADNYVLKALTALQTGKKVEPSSTEPYGCSVKYKD